MYFVVLDVGPVCGGVLVAGGGTHCMSLKIVSAHPRPDSAGHQPRERGVRSISSASPCSHCSTPQNDFPIYITNREEFHPSTPTPRNRGVPQKVRKRDHPKSANPGTPGVASTSAETFSDFRLRPGNQQKLRGKIAVQKRSRKKREN